MSAQASSEMMVDIGGYRLCLRCAGQGTPTVVFEAGLGDGLDPWATLLPRIAEFTRGCAYDRAGVGKSDKGPKPRTSQQMVNELRTLLHKANIEVPYVLVGHSLGGLNAQLYAAEYPNEVAGLVLVDPSFPDMMSRLERVWGKVRVFLFLTLAYASQAEGSSKQDFIASCDQVVSAGNLPDVPLIVISASQPAQMPPIFKGLFPGAGWVRTFQEGHAVLAKASSKSQHLVAEKSEHNTIVKDPLVVDAIRQMVEALRRN